MSEHADFSFKFFFIYCCCVCWFLFNWEMSVSILCIMCCISSIWSPGLILFGASQKFVFCVDWSLFVLRISGLTLFLCIKGLLVVADVSWLYQQPSKYWQIFPCFCSLQIGTNSKWYFFLCFNIWLLEENISLQALHVKSLFFFSFFLRMIMPAISCSMFASWRWLVISALHFSFPMCVSSMDHKTIVVLEYIGTAHTLKALCLRRGIVSNLHVFF